MLTLVDNVYISLIFGFVFSLLVTFIFHLFAILTEVQMSGKSLVFSTILFFILWLFSAQITSGIRAKLNLSNAAEAVESVYNSKLSEINAKDARRVIISLYPRLSNLFDVVEVNEHENSKTFMDDSQSTLNLNIWKTVGYWVISLLILGIPAFLFGQRRISYKERRHTRNSNTSTNLYNTQRSRYISRRR